MNVEQLLQELQTQGIHDTRVLQALHEVPRERFVPAEWQSAAYENRALPIDCEQTISQPYIVALMTQALQLTGDESVLEIGTGSGYQTAILARLCRQVYTIERWQNLTGSARPLLQELDFRNITFFTGDGTLGLPDLAPFAGIIVTAAAPRIPPAYWEQLSLHGRLVIPIGPADSQSLMRYQKTQTGWDSEELCGCRFVKLIGQQGWPETDDSEE